VECNFPLQAAAAAARLARGGGGARLP
jgi:hypothetical protein